MYEWYCARLFLCSLWGKGLKEGRGPSLWLTPVLMHAISLLCVKLHEWIIGCCSGGKYPFMGVGGTRGGHKLSALEFGVWLCQSEGPYTRYTSTTLACRKSALDGTTRLTCDRTQADVRYSACPVLLRVLLPSVQ